MVFINQPLLENYEFEHFNFPKSIVYYLIEHTNLFYTKYTDILFSSLSLDP